jgi:hypothetical protein
MLQAPIISMKADQEHGSGESVGNFEQIRTEISTQTVLCHYEINLSGLRPGDVLSAL